MQPKLGIVPGSSTLEFTLVGAAAGLVHPLRFWYLRGGRLIVLQFRGPCSDTGFRVDKEESLYLGYFDEFGHNGPYISRSHPTYKTHPVFGIGGFIIPAEHARELSARFRFIKEQGLKEEIDALVRSKGMPVEQWEKKGSALLTTKNIETYAQTRRIVFRVLSTLDKLGARVVFYGQQKPCGGPDTVLETTSQRYGHAMKQLITRVQGDLPGHETFLIVLDKQGKRERLEIFAETAAFMFSNNNADRLIEPPMEVESHLYQTVQCADWICAILGRISAYLLDPEFAEFTWAPKYFGTRLAALSTPSSKIRTLPGSKDIYPQDLAHVTA